VCVSFGSDIESLEMVNVRQRDARINGEKRTGGKTGAFVPKAALFMVTQVLFLSAEQRRRFRFFHKALAL